MAETTTKVSSQGEGLTNADYELHYFEGIRGAAQPIRWILIDANANWTEKLVPFDEWETKYKADESFSGLWRTLPVLQVNSGNMRISQLLTIVSYLGRKLNYYGTDQSAEGIARCDSIGSAAVLDVANALSKMLHLYARFQVDFNALYEDLVPKIENVLKRLDYHLGAQQFFCGDRISTADLLVFEAYEVALMTFGPILAAKYQRLDKLHDRIKERPRIKAWRVSGNMPTDITISTKYQEFMRLMRERFTADNSALEGLSAGAKKKLAEQEEWMNLKAVKGKGKGKDVGGGGGGGASKKQQKDEGELLRGKKQGVGVPLKTGVKLTK